MSPRKPNMLEAFQASAKAEQAKQEEARVADSSTSGRGGTIPAQPRAAAGSGRAAPDPSPPLGVGGPFAAESPAARLQPSGEDQVLGIAPRRAAKPMGKMPLVVILVALGMTAMFLLGRDFGKDSQAAEPQGAGDLEVPVTSGAPQRMEVPERKPVPVKASTLTAADRAFLSLENRLSVRAIQFSSDADGIRRATEVYRYLRAQGLPAVAPIDQGKITVICVGAEPSRNQEIERIRSALHALAGPPPRNEPGAFGSAYFVNIADQIDESLRH